MPNYSTKKPVTNPTRLKTSLWDKIYGLAAAATTAWLSLAAFTGCQAPDYAKIDESMVAAVAGSTNETPVQSDAIVLREGDSVRITFPGAPNLNTVQQIKRDGRVSLQLIGEFKALGM